MIFVDTNVFMYAVGREHPLRARAQKFFLDAMRRESRFVISAEVLQELMHAYVSVGRVSTLDAALELVARTVSEIWPLEPEDVRFARALIRDHGTLGARDLLYLACCRRRGVDRIKTFDKSLDSAFKGK
ncbi:MAG: type II toxin-antitoxin system VapC family toxin [Acidobacteria bacterium]|nr:type II toxin-antitoxin system VapC family toxin [Acidobacteriota bacterium]